MDHEKTSVMGCRMLFEMSGIYHSNSGLEINHDVYINGYFILLFDLTLDRSASEGHRSHPDNGNSRVELKFGEPPPETITCYRYLSNGLHSFFKIGHDADIVYAERREIVLGSLPLRYAASLHHAIWHVHKQSRSSQREKFTFASRICPTSSIRTVSYRSSPT